MHLSQLREPIIPGRTKPKRPWTRFTIVIFLVLGVGLLVLVEHRDRGSPSAHKPPYFSWQRQLSLQGSAQLHREPAARELRFDFMKAQAIEMPATMRRAISMSLGGGASALGLRFNQAKYLRIGVGVNSGIWVAEGNGVTCISSAKDGATSCDTSVDAWRHGMLLEVYKTGAAATGGPTDFLAVGVLPNWARGVKATVGRQGRRLAAPNGGYAIRADVPIKDVTPFR